MHHPRARDTITIQIDWACKTYLSVIGETTSLESIRTLAPGLWLDDGIMNIAMKKLADEHKW